MVSCRYSLKRDSPEFKMIRNAFTYPICFRLQTIYAMCPVSRPFESPNPGVSMTMTGSSPSTPCHVASSPVTESVSDVVLQDSLNFCWPQMEFAVVDLPLPVCPMSATILNFSDSASLPANAAAVKASSHTESFGTSIIRRVWASENAGSSDS